MGAAIKVTKMFDFVFIGTGAPCLLEAAFWSLKGKSVLMIDQENEIGGAWKSLNIFGYTNVENAVHYFLDNTLGIKFLQNKLNVPIEISSNKYRVFQFPLSVSIKLPFDNKFGKVISCFIGNFPQKINYIIKSIIEPNKKSFYIKGGAPILLKRIKKLLKKTNVQFLMATKLTKIVKRRNYLILSAGEKRLKAKTVFFSHGTRLSFLNKKSRKIIKEKNYRRPSIHLLIKDDDEVLGNEFIFCDDKMIKYVHNITRFAKKRGNRTPNQKIFVIALQPNILKNNKTIQNIFKKLKTSGCISKNAKLLQYFWQEIYLPRINDSDLFKLKALYDPFGKILFTENFTFAIANRAKAWSTIFKSFKC